MASVVANTYAKAIYEVAAEAGVEVSTLEQLKMVEESFKEFPELLSIMAAPFIPKAERLNSIKEVFGTSLSQENLNFLMLLCEKGRISEYSAIVVEYVELYYAANNIGEAVVTSAVPLTDTKLEEVSSKLSEITGKKIRLVTKVDPTILGGLVVEINGERMDSSVKTRIANIGRSFTNN